MARICGIELVFMSRPQLLSQDPETMAIKIWPFQGALDACSKKTGLTEVINTGARSKAGLNGAFVCNGSAVRSLERAPELFHGVRANQAAEEG
jgi:hypothetical protein